MQNTAPYGVLMVTGVLAATQIVVDAWVLLVAAASVVLTFVGMGLTITFQLAGRIDHVSGELVLVRERVARLEALFADRRRSWNQPDGVSETDA